MTNPTRRPIAARLGEFASALGHAISDTELGRERETRLYFDTEVVACLVLGFRVLQLESPRPDRPELLLRALTSCGFLGRIGLLRPHALELYQLIARHKRSADSRGFRQAVREFFEEERLADSVEVLAQRLANDPRKSESTSWLSEISKAGLDVFLTLELAHGAWEQRLARLAGSVIDWSRSEPELGEIASSPAYWQVHSALESVRPLGGLSNLRDAWALEALRQLADNTSAARDAPLVRFYTPASTLRRAVATSRMLGDLKGPRSLEALGRMSSVLVSRQYLLLRASFEALRVGASIGAGGSALSLVSLPELRKLHLQMETMLKLPAENLESEAKKVFVADLPLLQLLEELESGEAFHRILVSFEPPESLLDLVDGLRNSWKREVRGPVAARVAREVAKRALVLERDLSKRVHRLSEWEKGLASLLSSANRARLKVAEIREDFEPSRDLGLVRWGIELNQEGLEVLLDDLRAVLAEDRSVRSRKCAELLGRSFEVKTESACIGLCAVFWFLRLPEEVVRTISDLESRSGTWVSPSLLLMRTAARLGLGGSFSSREIEATLEALESLAESSDERLRPRRLVGVGYCWYHYWRNARTEGLGFEQRKASEDQRLLAKSLECARRAQELSKSDELAAAFALNHLAYASSTGSPESESAGDFLAQLSLLKDHPRVWNYRFADTFGYSEYLTVRREYREALDRDSLEASDELRAGFRMRLIAARELVVDSGPFFGDLEIDEHLAEIGDAIRRLDGAPGVRRPE